MRERAVEEYTLIKAGRTNELNAKVNEKLTEGWELYGPPGVAAVEDEDVVIQAVVKRERVDPAE
jgi:hypothetical protein